MGTDSRMKLKDNGKPGPGAYNNAEKAMNIKVREKIENDLFIGVISKILDGSKNG